jgi:hypothetical protein
LRSEARFFASIMSMMLSLSSLAEIGELHEAPRTRIHGGLA